MFDMRVSIIGVFVIDNHPHDIEQGWRVYTFAAAMPCCQVMTDVAPNTI